MVTGILFWGYDFLYFFAATISFRAGNSPYELETYFRSLHNIGWQAGMDTPLSFPYPPNFFLILYPFTYFSFEISRLMWIAGISLLLYISVLQWSNKLKLNIGIVGIVVLIASFPAFPKLFMFGQLSGLILSFWLIGSLALDKRPVLAGMIFSLSLIKPHFAIIPLIGITLHCYSLRQFKCMYGLGIGTLLQVLLCLCINAEATFNYIDQVSYILGSHLKLTVSQSPTLIDYIYNNYFLRVIFLSIGILTTITISLSYSHTWEAKITILLATSLLVSPYSWLHDFMLLLPSLFYFLKLRVEFWKIFVAASLLLFTFTEALIKVELHSLWEGLICMVAISLVLSANKKIRDREQWRESLKPPLAPSPS